MSNKLINVNLVILWFKWKMPEIKNTSIKDNIINYGLLDASMCLL